eukprot:4028084-Amphidinium_carterae.1
MAIARKKGRADILNPTQVEVVKQSGGEWGRQTSKLATQVVQSWPWWIRTMELQISMYQATSLSTLRCQP